MIIVPRTCTELRDEQGTAGSRLSTSKPLSAFRDRSSYVLLGDPGMGKSTTFQKEADDLGPLGLLVSARDLANLDADRHPEWQGKTLFIDGLDEIRTGGADPRTPLDRIRRNLDRLDKPSFRLSCRHADWLTTDQKSLASSSPSGKVTVLNLAPLNEQQATDLLQADPHVDNAGNFVKEARDRGMEGLLRNPQTLRLLVRAVHDGAWPAGPKETFDKACLAMAGEHNEEHLSVGALRDPNRVLDTAGRMCAVLLVSGASGYATSPTNADSDYPCMTVCGLSHADCREAISSSLFRHVERGLAEPVHRQIAEYIAARHIATLIQDGLPALRALALICGSDGTVVSELRGLSAWLAAHSELARHHLIERDPVGMALYGDIESLSANERRDLFDSLVREPRRLEPTYRTAPAFASLATQAMKPVLEQNIRNPPDDPDGQLVVDFALRLLPEAPPLADLSDSLLEVVRDGDRWPRVKNAAMTAIIHYTKGAEGVVDLLDLLRDIREHRIADPTDDLLGQLLTALYPRHISPDSVWDYSKESSEVYGGAYMRFWVSYLPSVSSDAAIAQLLNRCSERLDDMEQASNSTLESCLAKVLLRGLEVHGDDLDTARLYDWLDAGTRLRVGQLTSRSQATEIRSWIEARQHRHLDLLLEGIGRLPDNYWYAPYEVLQRLFGAPVSLEFFWDCAASAKSMYGDDRPRAESLLRFAAQSGDLEPQRIQSLVADNPDLAAFLQRVLDPPPPPPEFEKLERRRQEWHQEHEGKVQHELEAVQANEYALRSNTAPPPLLHRLAQRYFGDFMQFTPDSATERLQQLLAPHDRLLDAVQIGLLLTLQRRDVPDVERILEQRLESKMHYMCWPYLAGLAEAERTDALKSSWWTDAHIRKALAIYFSYAHGDYEPSWYRHLIAEHPEAVAEVQIQVTGALFRTGADTGYPNLWHLAYDRQHSGVARHASLPLLRAFPARAKSRLLDTLEYLLLAALQHADHAEFEQLVARKLSSMSMPPRQRARWLAAGCTIATAKFAPSAEEFLCGGRRQARALHFASFFCPQERNVFPVEHADTQLADFLVQFIGRIVDPDELKEGLVTPAMEASTLVSRCIRVLAGDTSHSASDALAGLLENPELSRWRHSLSRAADDQRVYRRDYEYVHPTAEQATKTLQGGPPASPADLAALVLDRLTAMAKRMRSGDTDDWKAFWNESGHGRPTDPKPEESCTQALARGLRSICPTHISIEREVRYPNGARPDISISYGDYRIPIEVKRSDNRHLWRAARSQLMAKYTIDPATNGYGLYVVLWFGPELTQRSPTGKRPYGPADLQKQLEATMTDHERRTVYISVIDIAAP